jgi:hypothetical protein
MNQRKKCPRHDVLVGEVFCSYVKLGEGFCAQKEVLWVVVQPNFMSLWRLCFTLGNKSAVELILKKWW